MDKHRGRIGILAIGLSLLFLNGCQIAAVASRAIPETVNPKYTGLGNETVGVMVWVDRGTRIDWPSLRIDLASTTQTRLSESKSKVVQGATFPVKPASIVRFQQDHPELEGMPITMIAPRLGVSRLIYIEVEHFRTRSDLALELFRGTGIATVRVIEVENGQARETYVENGITAVFPKKSPQEGLPGVGDYTIYAGTIDMLATEIARRFVPYRVED